MPGNFDLNALVNILSGAPSVVRKELVTPLTLHNDVTFSSVLVKTFTNTSDANADSEMSAGAKAAVAAFFQQGDPKPAKVKVGMATDVTTPYDDIANDLDLIRLEDDDWYGLDIGSRAEADLLAADTWTSTNDKLFLGQSSDATVLSATAGNVAEDLQTAASGRSGLLWHPLDAEHAVMAWFGNRTPFGPDDFSTIWAYARLKGLTPKTDFTQGEIDNGIEAQNANTISSFRGLPVVGPEGVLSDGSFIDTRIIKDWLKFRGEERLAQAIVDRVAMGSKFAFLDNDIEAMIKEVRAQAQRGEELGHLNPAYTNITAVKVEDVPVGDITARKLSIGGSVGVVQGVLAGAVQEFTVNFSVLGSPP